MALSRLSKKEDGAVGRFVGFWIYGSTPRYLFAYTVVFALFFLVYALSLLVHGRGFIWFVDGLEQQYSFFILEGNWLRELLANIFISHSFVVPQWTESVGYGADYLISVGNTLGNPINLLSVFATGVNADWLLNATVPITLYLAGLSFIWYCSYKEFDRSSVFVAAYAYVFSGFSLIAYSQIYMIYPLVVAPLALQGIDKVLNNESPLLLILSVALMCLASVATGYMLCLLMFLYCVARFFVLPKKTAKGFLRAFFSILGPVLAGIFVSCVLFLPITLSILDQSRLTVQRETSILYSASYYLKVLKGLFAGSDVGADCYYGYATVALVSLLLLFKSKGDSSRILKIMLVILTAVLLLPFAGRIFNGFAYPNNRWIWAFSLLVALSVAVTLPELWKERQERFFSIVAVSFLALVFFTIAYAVLVLGESYSEATSGSFMLMACVFFATLAILSLCAMSEVKVVFGSLVSLALSVLVMFYGSAWGSRVPLGGSYEASVENTGLSLVSEKDDAGEWRTDSAGTSVFRNANIAAGILGNTFYNSLYNGYVDEYHTSLGLATSSMNFSYCTLNSRSAMEALSGTKYFLTGFSDGTMLPPLFTELEGSEEIDNGSISLYSTDATLPLAYVSQGVVSRSDYDALNYVQRQNSMLKYTVLEDSDYGSVAGEPVEGFESDSSYEVGFRLSTSWAGDDDVPLQEDGDSVVEITEQGFVVHEPGAVVYLNADIPEGCEAYLILEGADYVESEENEGANEFKIFVYGDGMMQEIWNPNYRHHLYGGKDSWCVNVGYSSSTRSVIALQFRDAGTYSYDSLSVVVDSCDWMAECIGENQENSAENCLLSGNEFSCSYQSDEEALLYVRIPYSEGWSASVNGENVEIKRANVGFMTIDVAAGENELCLKYETPYLKEGAFLTLFGIAASVLLCRLYRRRSEPFGL